jgi:hypothetical protein
MPRLYDWLNDPQRNEKIFGSRLNDEFYNSNALPACFSVHRNGVDETGFGDGAYAQILWTTEVYDVGGYFASNAWVPPAGKVHLHLSAYMTGTVTNGNWAAAAIYKNGSIFKTNIVGISNATGAIPSVACDDIANGTDSYTAYGFLDVDSGTGTANGGAANTFFMGHWISA